MAEERDPLADATPGQKLFLVVMSFAGAALLVVVLVLLVGYLFK